VVDDDEEDEIRLVVVVSELEVSISGDIVWKELVRSGNDEGLR
jgi:hypothetical protein